MKDALQRREDFRSKLIALSQEYFEVADANWSVDMFHDRIEAKYYFTGCQPDTNNEVVEAGGIGAGTTAAMLEGWQARTPEPEKKTVKIVVDETEPVIVEGIVALDGSGTIEPLGARDIRQLKQQVEGLQTRLSKLEGGAK